jgi:hypothetical protein
MYLYVYACMHVFVCIDGCSLQHNLSLQCYTEVDTENTHTHNKYIYIYIYIHTHTYTDGCSWQHSAGSDAIQTHTHTHTDGCSWQYSASSNATRRSAGQTHALCTPSEEYHKGAPSMYELHIYHACMCTYIGCCCEYARINIYVSHTHTHTNTKHAHTYTYVCTRTRIHVSFTRQS